MTTGSFFSFQYASARNSSISLLHAYAHRCFVRGAEHDIGALAERHVGALAVHLGCGGDEDQFLLLVCVLQHDLRAVHVRLNCVDGLFDDELHADRGGEMEHHVAAVDHFGEQRLARDRIDDVREPLFAFQVDDVLDRTGRQVVEHEHVVSQLEQPFCEMGTDESGAAGNQRLHRVTGDSAVGTYSCRCAR